MDENSVIESKEADSDKHSGIALIKAEFVLTNHERTISLDHVAEEDKEKLADAAEEEDGQRPKKKRRLTNSERKKLRGQNKARPAPFKFQRETTLCPSLVDVLEDEELPKCSNPKCSFMHDVKEYLASKTTDIGPTCHIFTTQGRCPRGASCRFGSEHLTPEGRNKMNKELYEKFKKTEPKRNLLDKALQHSLRKHTYNFSKSENIITKYDQRKKEVPIQKAGVPAKTSDAVKKDTTNQEDAASRNKEMEQGASKEDGISTKTGENEVAKTEVHENGAPAVTADAITNKTPVQEDGVIIKTCGAVTDEDVVQIRKEEKKKVDWKGKLYLSPLTTVGNLPFRRICKEYGADITCGEMAMASSLLNGALQEWALVKRHESENLFGVQLCGNNPYVMTRCAQVIEENAQVDFIDVNLGCPIELVYQQGGGSGLLRREKVLGAVVSCMSETVSVPLTVKTRTGVYTDKNIAHNYMPKFPEWGASLITVHGRSREQRYTKSADWNYIEECAKLAAPCPVFGNGDVLSFEDYEQAFVDSPSISGVMIGRGALIKPWIFTEIKERRHWDISSSERLDILKKYVNNGLEHWGSDNKGVENTRRFLLEWLSFLHRYIPVGLLEHPPQKINQRPPYYKGRDDLETLMASPSCADWIRISEMLLGPVPENYNFLPKHKANSWK